jgi:hypothetical protein
MYESSKAHNIYVGETEVNKLSWTEFKDILLTLRNWKYDETERNFSYRSDSGYKINLSFFRIEMIATCLGFYENLEDYIDAR